MKSNKFLTLEEQALIENAVHSAEKKTSGELKVLVVNKSVMFSDRLRRISPKDAVEKRAIQEFYRMGLTETKDSTGILIMLSLKEKRVSVKADRAINEKVEPGTWDTTAEIIIKGIKAGQACKGICEAVEQVGNLLSEHFPIKPGDVNELPDDIEFKN